MSNQLFDTGTVIQPVGDMKLECVSVSYQETDGEKHGFVYGFQLKEEVDAARELAEAEAKAEQERQDQLNNSPSAEV